MKLTLTKDTNKILRWLTKAVTKDFDRPVLQCIHSNGVEFACDGFRLHAANIGMDPGTWRIDNVPASATEVEGEPEEGRYPLVTEIIPKTEPVFEFGVRVKYLKEAIEAMTYGKDSWVRLRLHSPKAPMEVMGDIAEGQPGYAIVMPIHLDPSRHNWRPA